MKKQYIQAALEMIASGKAPEAVLAGLAKTLEAKGHMRLHASVLQGVLRILETQKTKTTAIVTIASEKAGVEHAKAIKEALSELSTEFVPETKIDETIIGGFTAEFNNVLIDKSYKAQLVSLYRKLAK